MTVKASANHFDTEAAGDAELELVVVTYVGPRSMYHDNAVRNQGNWPSYGPFQNGVPQVGFMPDRSLGWWESHADFEIEYSTEAIAKAFLQHNFLAPDVFGSRVSPEVQERVLDKLGMEYVPRNGDEIRQELAEIAGVDEPGEESEPMESFEHELNNDYTRSELQNIVGEVDEEYDEDLSGAKKTEMATWLSELDESDVRTAIASVTE